MVTQKSASQVAEGYIIIQALKYLEDIDYSIAEIAYLLKFNDPAYFSCLFKKHKAVSQMYKNDNHTYDHQTYAQLHLPKEYCVNPTNINCKINVFSILQPLMTFDDF
jgi:AraC-like DNA-binding protein